MTITHRRDCPICGGVAIRHLFDNVMAPVADVDMSYRVGDCTSCGFSFAYDLPDDATYQHYYRTLSKYDVSATLSKADQTRFSAIARVIGQDLQADAIVVDIGCGEGALLAQLQAAGFSHLYGVDPAPNIPQVAQQKYGLDCIQTGFLGNAASVAPLAAADCVCLAAVLEHLPQLRSDLTGLLSHLKPGCTLVLEVPTLELFDCAQAEPYGEFSLEHIHYFCRDSLSQLMASLGWICKHTEYLAYPELQTGSVISAFVRSTAGPSTSFTDQVPRLDRYIRACQTQVEQMVQKLPAQDIIVWGAGSHSARLLPLLEATGTVQIRALVDGNPNLIGKTLGDWTIESPAVIAGLSDLPVVISSFRAQHDIAAQLVKRFPNPLVLLYP